MKTYFSKYFVLLALYTFAIGMAAVNSFAPQTELALNELPKCADVGLGQMCELPSGVPQRPTVIPGAGVDVDPSKTVPTRPRRQSTPDIQRGIMMDTATAMVVNQLTPKAQRKSPAEVQRQVMVNAMSRMIMQEMSKPRHQ